MKPLCAHCNVEMQASTNTFTVAKQDTVYVVREVPCWECLSCGHMEYDQAVAERLENYVARRASPRRSLTAWEYGWKDEIVYIPSIKEHNSTSRIAPLVLVIAGKTTA